ncbi:MAG: metal-dependent hydrolase [Magnetococcales bacterium]|nr:metal-dependent hydrolase [Magnetococcales bacterium]NGZ26640.1 metal-dependent hydrolase [Magnetococcales bacterium]
MPTIFSHPAVPLAMGLGLGRQIIPPPLLATGIFLAILPDLDMALMRLGGIAYADNFGHRGFSHSFVFALVIALLVGKWATRWQSSFRVVFWFLFVSLVSHGILDCFTNGGHGIGLLWPFSDERFFAPWQPIEVAPLRLARFFSMRGVEVLTSELIWVWFPALLVGLGLRRWQRPTGQGL